MRFAKLSASFAAALALAGCGGSESEPPQVLVPSQTVRVPADYADVASAIAAAPAGYTILLSDGVYTGSGNTNLNFGGKPLTLRSVNGPSSAVIDCEGRARFFTFDRGEDARSSISGLTVRNCGASFEGAIYVLDSAPVITGNVFENTSGGAPAMGAAIFGFSGSPRIEKNVFRNTECDDQALSGVLAFINSSSPFIANNVFVNNRCRAVNMTLPEGAVPAVLNNTMVGNRAGIYIDRRVSSALHWYANNLIVGNERGVEVAFEFTPRADDLSAVFRNNMLFGNVQDYLGTSDLTGQQGNLRADPLFVNAPADLRLGADSPARNAGNSVRAPADDFSGRQRSGPIDIGAFEAE